MKTPSAFRRFRPRLALAVAHEMLTVNTMPAASNVSISGTLNVGETLTGTYDYSDPEGHAESGSTYQWYRADDASGTNAAAISGATALTYEVVADDTGKYLRLGVTPSDGDLVGSEAFSVWTEIPVPFSFADLTPVLWYDPTDLSTMFQDTAGTIPVTASGQVVKRINNKGSATAPLTSSVGATYVESGGLKYLDFARVASQSLLNVSTTALRNQSRITRMIGVKFDISNQVQNADNSVPAGSACFADLATTKFYATNQSGDNYGTRPTTTNNRAIVLQFDGTQAAGFANRFNLRIDGAAVSFSATAGTAPATSENSANGFCLGGRAADGGSNNMDGRIYQYIALHRLLTVDELAESETLLASLSGVTLP